MMDSLAGTPPPPGMDEALAQSPSTDMGSLAGTPPPPGMDEALAQDTQDQYGTSKQSLLAGVEGVAKGVLGPIATGAERYLDVPREDVVGRQKANPTIHAVGEGVGLVGSALTGVGEGALMSHIGEGAAALAGLGDVAKAGQAAATAEKLGAPAIAQALRPRLSYKIGSEAVKQATEMAVFQGSDEASKMILKDPETATESAVANVGLAAVLGGAGGAAIGTISPLWSATGGKLVQAGLDAVKGTLNGGEKAVIPDVLETALKDAGVELSPVMRGALSGNEKALLDFQSLAKSGHPEVLADIKALPDRLRQAITDKLDISLNDAAHFDNELSGKAILDKLKENTETRYAPQRAAYKELEAENNLINVADESRLDIHSQLQEMSMGENYGPSSSAFKEFQQAGDQILDKKTVGGLTQLSSDLGAQADHMATDPIRKRALYDIKDVLDKAIDNEISQAAIATAGKDGAQLGADAIAQRKAVSDGYHEYSKTNRQLMENLGLGRFRGTRSMEAKLDKLTPEMLLSRFSTKGDAGAQEFLTREFPEVAQMVKEHEAKQFLSKSIETVDGAPSLRLQSLAKRLDDLKKGSPSYADWVLSPEAQKAIRAGDIINDYSKKLTNFKDSGTTSGITKAFRYAGSSALAAVGMMMGHNPFQGYLIGELANHVGKTMPEARKLAALKFIGSDQPAKAEGFKAMTDLMHNTMKGENMLGASAKAVFKAGAQEAASHFPDQADRDKVDKAVTKLQDAPGKVPQLANDSHLGHYMPAHQAALTQAQVRSTQYLQSIKPQPKQLGPLDKPVEPSTAQTARYNRALDIAAHPAVVMQHIKDGTLQPTDIQDLHAMFPALAKNMASKLATEMTHAKDAGTMVPYRTKIALSLFLGQGTDASMSPSSIQAAQPMSSQPQQPQAGGKMKGGAKTATTMNKNANSYKTTTQAGESDRGNRD